MLDSFIRGQERRGLHFSQEKCCHMFGVSRSGYNAWKDRREKLDKMKAAQELEDEKIKDMFRKIVKKLCYVPGKRTFRTFLWRDYHVSISVKKCRRIMNEMKLIPNHPKKDAYKNRATHDHETKAPKNLVGQDFRLGPRKVILTDITYLYHGYDRSLFYLCTFKDAHTTEILGAAIGLKMDVSLVKAAYERMMRDHGNELHEPGILIHSDQGSQYMSTTFKQLLSDDGFIQSASHRGNSLDNAPMESFFGRLKCAILDIVALCKTYDSAKKLVENYLYAYNNTIYRNDLAGLTPVEYYTYVTTGVYPCEDYYGVKPTEMMTIVEYVGKRMELAAEKEKKRRERNRRKKDDGKITCPPDLRVGKDLTVLKHLIDQHKGIQKEAAAWIEKNQMDIFASEEAIKSLEETMKKAASAGLFLKSLPEEKLLELWYPENWGKYPVLDYRNEMDDLYDNNPLRQYRAENGELLTGRKYRKYVA